MLRSNDCCCCCRRFRCRRRCCLLFCTERSNERPCMQEEWNECEETGQKMQAVSSPSKYTYIWVYVSLAAAFAAVVGWLVEIYIFFLSFRSKNVHQYNSKNGRTCAYIHYLTHTHRQICNCGAYMCVHQMLRSSQHKHKLTVKKWHARASQQLRTKEERNMKKTQLNRIND